MHLESPLWQLCGGRTHREMPGDICTMAIGYICCARCLPAHGQGQSPAGQSRGGAELAGVSKGYQSSASHTGGEPPALCKFKPSHTVGCFAACPSGLGGKCPVQRAYKCRAQGGYRQPKARNWHLPRNSFKRPGYHKAFQ